MDLSTRSTAFKTGRARRTSGPQAMLIFISFEGDEITVSDSFYAQGDGRSGEE
jgi:hypothetical protein